MMGQATDDTLAGITENQGASAGLVRGTRPDARREALLCVELIRRVNAWRLTTKTIQTALSVIFQGHWPRISTRIDPPWERGDLINIRLLLVGQSPPWMPDSARCGDRRAR